MKRLLVVGWDAADWKVIRPLLAAGEMPNLASLMAQGAHGNIATIYPPLSPMLWTSISTGKRPHKHGIHGFIEPTEDGMSVRPISNLSRTAKTFWNILNQEGKRSIVAGWWPSHPAEPIRGAMVSDHFPFKTTHNPAQPMLPGTISPANLADDLADLRVHPVDVTGDILRMFVPRFAEVDQDKDRSLHDLAGIVAETMSIHAAFTDLMEREEWDLGAVYYCGIDHFSHRFMRYHAGKVPKNPNGADPAIYADVIKNAYRYHDLMLGRLLQLAGDDCGVILLSDHGFHSDRLLPDYIPSEAAGPAIEHRHFGIVCMRAPGVPAASEIYGASVLDITPTVLHLFGLPAGADMDGKVLTNSFPGQPEKPRIPSWEQVPGDDGRHPATTQYDSVSAAESLQQLVDLGYIAPLGPDTAKNVASAVTENRYNLARACLDAGRTDLGSQILTELIAQDPEQGRFHNHLIQCLLQEGRWVECHKALDAFDAAAADFAPRALEELKRKRAEKADEEVNEDDDGARDAGRKERRLRKELAEKATGFSLDRLTLRARLALAQPRSGEKKQAARRLLEQIAFAQSKHTGAKADERVGLGLFLADGFAALGEHDCALEYLRAVRRANPDDHQAMSLSARVHLASKRYDKAVEDAVESLALVYHQPLMHLVLGEALERLGDRERAEQSLRVALVLHPGMAAAHRALGSLLRRDRNRVGEAALHTAQANVLRDAMKRRKTTSLMATEEPSHPFEPSSLTTLSAGFTPPADRSKVITVVSGLPRSGTSMMMQMLAAGGIEPYTDAQREADEDNPRGYFEHKQATELTTDTSWLPEARGKAVKIVAHLLPHLPPRGDIEYRIVFMHRDLDEVIASQSAMLDRLGRRGARLKAAQLSRAYASQLVRVEEWLRRARGVATLTVRYTDVVADPAATAERISQFVGSPFDAPQAAGAVDPSLWRQRREAVTASAS